MQRDDGWTSEVPIGHYFRRPAEFESHENLALSYACGSVLDVGAGTGIFSAYLQDRGLDVTALDVEPEAIRLCAERGVKKLIQADITSFREGRYDTVLLLGNCIGVFTNVEQLSAFFLEAHSLVSEGGQVILDSADARRSSHSLTIAYARENERRGVHRGHTRLSVIVEGVPYPWFSWGHYDFETLSACARASGWNAELLLEGKKIIVLARFTRTDVKSSGA